jgi:hypothetical protein
VLVFVGEMAGNEYGRNLSRRIDAAARIRITGYVDAAKFDGYLCAADAAIQLRGVSRGETSRTALDCLANGLPLIVNSSGSLAELPDDVVVRLPSDFSDEMLAEALTRIARDPNERNRLGRRAREYVASGHDPHRVAPLSTMRSSISRGAAVRCTIGRRFDVLPKSTCSRRLIQSTGGRRRKVSPSTCDDPPTDRSSSTCRFSCGRIFEPE